LVIAHSDYVITPATTSGERDGVDMVRRRAVIKQKARVRREWVRPGAHGSVASRLPSV